MAVRKMQQCLNSWHTRVFNFGFQEAKILKICACLSPLTWAKEIEKQIYRLIKIGKM